MDPRGVLAIIRRTDGAILMQHRDENPEIAWPGHWSILGGGLEPGESECEGIIREVEEEAGFTPMNPRLLTRVTDHHGSGQDLAVYVAEMPETSHLILGEGQELRFVTPSERRSLRVPPYIRELLDGHFHPQDPGRGPQRT